MILQSTHTSIGDWDEIPFVEYELWKNTLEHFWKAIQWCHSCSPCPLPIFSGMMRLHLCLQMWHKFFALLIVRNLSASTSAYACVNVWPPCNLKRKLWSSRNWVPKESSSKSKVVSYKGVASKFDMNGPVEEDDAWRSWWRYPCSKEAFAARHSE